MNGALTIRFAGSGDIETVRQLAEETWPVAYGTIISKEQMMFMLDMFYTNDSLLNQMNEKGHVFILAEFDGKAVGFASFSSLVEPGIYKLHKLYIHPDTQGKGVGKALIEFVLTECRKVNATKLRLGVNKNNPAVQFYGRMGFTKYKDEVTDIGNGYVMDDFILERVV